MYTKIRNTIVINVKSKIRTAVFVDVKEQKYDVRNIEHAIIVQVNRLIWPVNVETIIEAAC